MDTHDESGSKVSPTPDDTETLPMILCIGNGALGAKAQGLADLVAEVLPRFDAAAHPGVHIEVPPLVVISSGCFTAFMELNRLWQLDIDEMSDSAIAQAFLLSDLPDGLLEHLRELISSMRRPLAVRSSSFLEGEIEDAYSPFSMTKMIPNNQTSDKVRLRRLVDAVKLVWASTFFDDAVSSRRAAGHDATTELMSVIVQEVLGSFHGERYYPTVSGVARSYNHYPVAGMRPDEGLVSLCHGLGKTLVDGEASWVYSPANALAPPPFKSNRDMLRFTQVGSWAINAAYPEAPNPIRDSECLVRMGLREAEDHGTLKYVASTWDHDSERLQHGLGGSGPRVIDFGPLLHSTTLGFKEAVRDLLATARSAMRSEVDIEFAVDFDLEGKPVRIGLVQMRTLSAPGERFPVECDEARPDAIVVGSDDCLGNGSRTDIHDIIYLRQEHFSLSRTRLIAAEIEAINRGLVDEGRQSILIGFGRWGSSDERSGVPIRWAQVSSARAIVEVEHPSLAHHLSHGATLFHRLINHRVFYLSVGADSPSRVNWQWLDSQPAEWQSHNVRHVHLEEPLEVRVDGTTGCGIIRRLER